MIRQLGKALGHPIEGHAEDSFGFACPMLMGPGDERGLHPQSPGSLKIQRVGGDHESFLRPTAERRCGLEVDRRLGLIIPRHLSAKDRMPAPMVMPRKIGQERDIPV